MKMVNRTCGLCKEAIDPSNATMRYGRVLIKASNTDAIKKWSYWLCNKCVMELENKRFVPTVVEPKLT